MNFEGFKKIKSDKNITTLKHDKGHEIKILHSVLKPEMKKKLDNLPFHKMAEGGSVDSDKPTVSKDEDFIKSIQSDQPIPEPEPLIGNKTQGALNERERENAIAGEERTPAEETTPQETIAPKLNVSQVAATPNPMAQSLNQYEQGMTKGYEQQLAGKQTELQGLSQQGREMEQAQKEYADRNRLAQQEHEKNLAGINQQEKETQDWLNSHPENANRYLDKMSTGGKIKTAIGLLLGGLGSGLSGGPNLAAKFLDDQINNDLEAQKNMIGTKKGLLDHFRQQGMNERDAFNAARLTNLQVLNAALGAARGKAQTAQAAGALQSTQGVIGQQIEQLKHNMAIEKMQYGVGTGGAGDPARLAVAMIKEPTQLKESLAEIKDAENAARIAPKIMKAFDDAAAFDTSKATPGLESSGQKAFSGLINTTVKELEGTARQAAFDSINKNMRPQFGDSPETLARKRKLVKDYLISKASAPVSRGHGIDLSQYPTTRIDFGDKQIPGQQYEQRIINGKSYHVPVGSK